jgi:CRISPR-associated protein Cmr4
MNMNESSERSQGEPKDNEDRCPYTQVTRLGICLDPIHIGTGGYRLGRVDNTIARDPATNLPILFGSSIEGTARTYSAYKLIEDDTSIKKGEHKKEYLDCAGKSVEEGAEQRIQCGNCEICVTYGYSNKKRSLHGMAQFSDARILFFPVHTLVGPVWVTSPQILNELFPGRNAAELESKLSIDTNGKVEEKAWICDELRQRNLSKINLGWLYLETISQNDWTPKDWSLNIQNAKKCELRQVPQMSEILKRMVIVSDGLFSQVVNSNLEVRTSVSIDPRTGAAEEGALFTYEAIPRGTVMYFSVTFLNPKNFQILENKNSKNSELKILENMQTVKDTVKKGLELFEFLGLGGMGTRGFGRFKVLNLKGA